MADRLAKSIKEDYLSCSVCLDQFRQPKRLPCQHIYCQHCLVDHVTSTLTRQRQGNKVAVSIQCPLCRYVIDIHCDGEFSVKAWVSGLPDDILINSLLHKLDEHEIKVSQHGFDAHTLCVSHGNKLREAFCFTHAQLVCWECAAREHRKCKVDSADKARSIMEPNVDKLKKEVCAQLVSAREMCAIDQDFADSKTKALSELNTLEKDIDNVLSSAKRQIAVLRGDVERISRRHLEQRRGFYDVVTALFEMNHALEAVNTTSDAVNMIAKMNSIQAELEFVKAELTKMGPPGSTTSLNQLVFIPDEHMSKFLNVYSGVGFVDPDVSQDHERQVSIDAPLSLAHILNRTSAKETNST